MVAFLRPPLTDFPAKDEKKSDGKSENPNCRESEVKIKIKKSLLTAAIAK
jgi:hypothetical protein